MMGQYALYVWGAVGFTGLVLVLTALAAGWRYHRLLKSARFYHAQTGEKP